VTDLVPQPCVLRILNGPLQGCEFPIGPSTTLFVVGAVDLLGQGACATSVPADAIFVPMVEGGRNFEVLGEHVTLDGLPLRLLSEPAEIRHCTFHTRIQLGSLHIALRPAEQAWAPGLLLQQRDPSIDADPDAFVRRRGQMTRWVAGSALLVLLVAAMVIGSGPGPTPETDIRTLIAGASAEVEVLSGRDQAMYVFVSSERDAGWSRQVLGRSLRAFHRRTQGRRAQGQVIPDRPPGLHQDDGVVLAFSNSTINKQVTHG
jgi:hypothetical protein